LIFTKTGTILIFLLAAAWLAQLGLSLWQTRRFYRRLSELRQHGVVSIGMAGSNWRGKTYAMLAIDDQDVVRRAEQLSGITVFALPKPVPALEGQALGVILRSDHNTYNLKKKTFQACVNAAEEYLKRHEQSEGESAGEAVSADL
jgi:glucitol operon activator protein